MEDLTNQIIWFIGAPLNVKAERNGQIKDITLPKAEAGCASTSEVIDYMLKLDYAPNYKPSAIKIYRKIKQLLDGGYVVIKNQKYSAGRPMNIYGLTEKGKLRRAFINSVNESHALVKNPSDILFKLDPNGRWMSAHVITYDPEFIAKLRQELAKFNRERGRPENVLLFRGDQHVFRDAGSLVFLLIIAMLRMRGRKITEQVSEKVSEILDLLPGIFEALIHRE